MNFLRKRSRFVIAAFGDTHGGNKLGLMNPETKLQDPQGFGYSPQLGKAQEYLFPLYNSHVNSTIDFADGDSLYLLHLGDISQGKKYDSELVSTKIADQFEIARANFWPWLRYKKLEAIRLVIGTSSHIFGEATSETVVAGLLRSDTKANIGVCHHGLLNIRGALIDYAHHGPNAGKRNWLKGNEARYYLRSLMMDELHAGNIPPHLVFRGHYHSVVEEYLGIPFRGKRYPSWLYVLPSYCLLGEYGQQATLSQFSVTNGMIVTEVIDGQVGKATILEQTLDIRTKEEI